MWFKIRVRAPFPLISPSSSFNFNVLHGGGGGDDDDNIGQRNMEDTQSLFPAASSSRFTKAFWENSVPVGLPFAVNPHDRWPLYVCPWESWWCCSCNQRLTFFLTNNYWSRRCWIASSKIRWWFKVVILNNNIFSWISS